MESAVALREEKNLVKIEDYAMSVNGLLGQVALIQRVMKEVMKEGEHYGVIPGTDKPTLLKPGAEKLALTFRLDPRYDIIEKVREKDFIAYTVKCTLFHIISGQEIASGIGSCNSRETKYRYRMIQSEKKPSKEEAAILKAKGLGKWKKFGESWSWMDRVENDNPWDQDNTLIKMACKRALVAATLNATAASDIFTQDLEDMPTEVAEPAAAKQAEEQPQDDIPKFKPPETPNRQNETKPGAATEKQKKMLYAKMREAGLSSAEAKDMFAWYTDGKDLTIKEASHFIETFPEALDTFQTTSKNSANVVPEGM